jgi:hypothetical protein
MGRMGGFMQKEHVCKIDYVYRLNDEEKDGNVVALDGAVFGNEQEAITFCRDTYEHAQYAYYLTDQPELITLTLPKTWSYREPIEWIFISLSTLALWWFFSGWAVRYYVLEQESDNFYARQ